MGRLACVFDEAIVFGKTNILWAYLLNFDSIKPKEKNINGSCNQLCKSTTSVMINCDMHGWTTTSISLSILSIGAGHNKLFDYVFL